MGNKPTFFYLLKITSFIDKGRVKRYSLYKHTFDWKLDMTQQKAYYHLPGLYEFYDFYKEFLKLFSSHKEYFYEWVEIGSVYGAPKDCLWGGGRVGFGEDETKKVLSLCKEYGISARLCFSNSLLNKEHLSDKKCNRICKEINDSVKETNGVIIFSDLLKEYIKANYKNLYLVSSTTKVLTDFEEARAEIKNNDFKYVVLDFRLNKSFEKFDSLSDFEKAKVEFLINECCDFGCMARKACYENVSQKNLSMDCPEFVCKAPMGKYGYRFSEAMKNPGFISVNDIKEKYLPKGFSNFKIEGRGLGSALILEFLLYYMVKPEYQLKVREEIYLDSMLDLF